MSETKKTINYKQFNEWKKFNPMAKANSLYIFGENYEDTKNIANLYKENAPSYQIIDMREILNYTTDIYKHCLPNKDGIMDKDIVLNQLEKIYNEVPLRHIDTLRRTLKAEEETDYQKKNFFQKAKLVSQNPDLQKGKSFLPYSNYLRDLLKKHDELIVRYGLDENFPQSVAKLNELRSIKSEKEIAKLFNNKLAECGLSLNQGNKEKFFNAIKENCILKSAVSEEKVKLAQEILNSDVGAFSGFEYQLAQEMSDIKLRRIEMDIIKNSLIKPSIIIVPKEYVDIDMNNLKESNYKPYIDSFDLDEDVISNLKDTLSQERKIMGSICKDFKTKILVHFSTEKFSHIFNVTKTHLINFKDNLINFVKNDAKQYEDKYQYELAHMDKRRKENKKPKDNIIETTLEDFIEEEDIQKITAIKNAKGNSYDIPSMPTAAELGILGGLLGGMNSYSPESSYEAPDIYDNPYNQTIDQKISDYQAAENALYNDTWNTWNDLDDNGIPDNYESH